MIQNDTIQVINKIKKKLEIMTRSRYRTTHFSLIEFFAGNNFQPISQPSLIEHLVFDYRLDPDKFVLSNENGNFKSEKTFIMSIKKAIKKNRSFVTGPGEQLSLDFKKTLEYLETMYPKYKNNSKDIKTPLKLSRRNNRESKRHMNHNVKKEKSFDDSDYEIDSYKRQKVDKYDFHSPEKLYFKRNLNFNVFNKENESQNKILSINDSDSDSYPFSDIIKKEVKKDNYNNYNIGWIPDIFSRDLFQVTLTSILEKAAISDCLRYISDYLAYIEDNFIIGNKEMEEESKRLEEIKTNLKELDENKNEYDSICNEVKNWQKEIYYIYQVMQNQLNAIKIEINNKTYCYDAYIKLRDIILNYEAKYNNVVDSLSDNLNELIELDKKSVEKQSILKKLLNNFNTKKRLINSIEKAAKINHVFSLNHINLGNYPNYPYQNDRYYYMDIKGVMNDFQYEKMKIIDAVNDIDNDIGNITI